jgi:hypothetical protein
MKDIVRNRAERSSRVSRRLLWFGFLGAAMAWVTHLVGASLVSEWGCFAGWGREQVLGVSTVAWAIVGLTVVSLIVGLAALGVAYRNFRWWRQRDPQELNSQDAAMLLAQAGFPTSAIFVFMILAESIPIVYYLTEC